MVCAAIGKCVLIILNVLFMVISLALIAAGAILAFVPGVVLEKAYDAAKTAAANQGWTVPGSADDIENFPMVYEVGIALFVFGIFLFFVSMMGCCGSCCASCCRCMLIIFAVVMIVLMLAELVIGTMFYVRDSPLHDGIRDNLKQKCRDDYKDDGDDPFSMAMNLIHEYFDCCGIDGGSDFNGKPHRSCEAQYENVGCYTKLTDLIQDNIIWAGLALAGILALQLLEVIFAIVIYKDASKIGPI